MIYTVVIMTVLMGMGVFAVDVGRILLSKSQLQDAADAAARYAASGMANSSTPQATAQAHALAAIGDRKIEGAALNSSHLTTTVGTWNALTNVFTATTTNPNAVKVDLTYRFTSGNGRPPLFLNVIAPSQQPLVHASVVTKVAATASTFSPPASGNLWLSGMPAGTLTKNFRNDNSTVWDYAGTSELMRQSPLPLQLSSMNLSEGDALSFEGLTGTASYVAGATNSADGDSGFVVSIGQTRPNSVPTNNLNGIANVRAPIGAVMAVFLNDDSPTSGSTPSCLDFASASQRNYSSISPQLKQVFFVGDGKKSDGTVQKIIVPPGATRVCIGMMDAWQWNDNIGNFSFKVYGSPVVTTVR